MKTTFFDREWAECPDCGAQCQVHEGSGFYECKCGFEGSVYDSYRRVLVLEGSDEERKED